jgi:urease accessory protein
MIRRLPALAAALVAAGPAAAHTGLGAHDSFADGFAHPLLGLDHVLAMVAVGLWAALVGGRALFAWPLAFVGVMVVGAVVGFTGLALPGLEAAIALSVAVLGLAVGFRAKLPVLGGAALCGAFAFAHGFAHGAELPQGAAVSAYVAGFVLATAVLHAAGLGLGAVFARADRRPRAAVRLNRTLSLGREVAPE